MNPKWVSRRKRWGVRVAKLRQRGPMWRHLPHGDERFVLQLRELAARTRDALVSRDGVPPAGPAPVSRARSKIALDSPVPPPRPLVPPPEAP